jgi:DNA repair exonuclease SbcCD ATPase subunit
VRSAGALNPQRHQDQQPTPHRSSGWGEAPLEIFEKLGEQYDALNEEADELGPLVAAASELDRCRKEHARRAENLARAGDPGMLRVELKKVSAAFDSAGDERRSLLNASWEELRRLGSRLRSLTSGRGAPEHAARTLGKHLERHKAAVDGRGAAQQRHNQASQRVRGLDMLAAEAVCSRCGQPISAEHLQQERSDASAELEATTADLTAKRAAVKELQGALAQADTQLADLTSARSNAVTAAKAAAIAEEELHRAAKDLATAQAKCEGLAPPGRVARDLAAVITGPLDQAALAVDTLTRAHTDLQTQIKHVKNQRDQARINASSATTALQGRKHKYDELQNFAEQAKTEARHCTQQAELRLEGIPLPVASAVRAGDESVVPQLQAQLEVLADAQHARKQLEEAEAALAGVQANLSSIQDGINAIPAEHRIPVADAEAALEAAKQQLANARRQRDDARDRHYELSKTLKRRQQLDRELGAWGTRIDKMLSL